jgi:EmrB/QacA subfamily drug resistance transporter
MLCALAQTMPALIAARFLQGIGGGGLRAVSQAVIADMVAPRDRGRYQGFISTVYAMSSAIGPVLGGFFTEYLSWHWIFWFNLPFGLAALAVVNHHLKRLRKPSRRPVIDWLGAVLILAAAMPILIGIGRVQQAGGWMTAAVLVPIAIGAVCSVALVFRELVAPEPMLPPSLFRNRVFVSACSVQFLMAMVMIGTIIIVPLDYLLVVGMSTEEAGLRLIPLTVAISGGSFTSGLMVSRWGRARIFPIAGAICITASCAAISFYGLGQVFAYDVAITALLGLGLGCQFTPITVTLQSALDFGHVGVGMSCMLFFRLMGGAFGVAFFSTVLIRSLNGGALTIPGHEVLGPHPGLALFHLQSQASLSAGFLQAAHGTLAAAFSRLFLVAALVGIVNFLAASTLKETMLRGFEPRSRSAKPGSDGRQS